MQISGSASASQLFFLRSSSSTAATEPAVQGAVSQKVEPATVAELAPRLAPTPSAGEELLAGVLERLQFSAREDGDHHHHRGRGVGRGQVNRELKQITRAVRHELRELGKSLAGDSEAEGVEDTRDEQGIDVRHELKHLGKDFKHELKHAFEDAGEGHHFDAESLVEAVRTAFDNLLAGLESILGSPEMPVTDAESVDTPPGATEPTDAQPLDATLTGTAASSDPAVPTTAVVVGEEIPAEVTTEAVADPSITAPAAGDLTSPLQELLHSFGDRFPSLLSQLQDLLSNLGELQIEGDAEAAGDSQAPSRMTFDFVISTYTQVSLSFSVEQGSGLLDSVA